ncbi:MAG: DUF3108 domain-containing protein [Pseudomonadota bacterium]
MSKTFPRSATERRLMIAGPAIRRCALGAAATLALTGFAPAPADAEESAGPAIRLADAQPPAQPLEQALQKAAKAPTKPAKPLKLRHTYDIYLGGVPIAEGRLRARVTEISYAAKTDIRAAGVLQSMFEARVQSQTQGSRPDPESVPRADALNPGVFQMKSIFQDKKFDMRMDFAEGAPSEIFAEPKYKKKKYEIDPKDQRGALDPISAVLMAFLPAASGDVCDRTIPVFDGRRRFDIVFLRAAKSYEEGRRRIVECDAVFRRVAGFKPSMMKKRDFPFVVKFNVRRDGRPTATQAWGETDYGVAMVTLRQ